MDPLEQFAENHRTSANGCLIGLVVARNGKFFEQFVMEFPQAISADKLKDLFIEAGMEIMAVLRMHDRKELSPDVINLTRPIREVYKEYAVIEIGGKYFLDDGTTIEDGHWGDISQCSRWPIERMQDSSFPYPSIGVPSTAKKIRIRVKETIEVMR